MSKLGISTGTTPNDATGDSLLQGAIKINSNFNEIYSAFGDGNNLKNNWITTSVGIHTLSNVGIGTTNPQYKLDVGGDINVKGTLYQNGVALPSSATSTNTASTLVARDSSGNFSAGIITATTFSGNASSATILQTARNINGVSFNGSGNITITANTTNSLSAGSYLTGSAFNGGAAVTFAVDATSENTSSKVVARDELGGFSAGIITATTFSGNASSATTLATTRTIWGQNFNGSANISGNLTSVGNITGSGTITINAGGATTSITLTTDGRLGLGTSIPSYLLHAVQASEETNPESDAGAYWLFQNSSTTLNTCSALSLGTNSDLGTAIVAQRVGANNEHVLKFQTRNSAGSIATRMTLTGTGLGIGTTGPGHALQVNGAICATGTFGTASASTVVLDVSGDARILTTGPSGGGYNPLAFAQVNSSGGGYTERARIDSSGRLLVGTSSARLGVLFEIEGTSAGTSGAAITRNSNNSAGPVISFSKSRSTSNGTSSFGKVSTDDVLGAIDFYGADGSAFINAASISAQADGDFATAGDTTDSPGRLVFSTTADGASSPTERMRITSSGKILLGTTVESSVVSNAPNSANGYYLCRDLTTDPDRRNWSIVTEFNSVGDFCILSGTTNTETPTTVRMQLTRTGAAYNTTGTWGTLSDITLKQDIQDASSQWDDVRNLSFKKYRLIEQVEQNGDAPYLLGVIAQEVEQTSPGLVQTDANGIKSVKQSVLLMKAAKALQEAMERIETLEAKVAVLESA